MIPPLASTILAAWLVAAPVSAFGQAGTGPDLAPRRDPNLRETSPRGLAARERQRKCGAEWRALARPEKEAQGPRWPQYYSKCVRRLKEQRA